MIFDVLHDESDFPTFHRTKYGAEQKCHCFSIYLNLTLVSPQDKKKKTKKHIFLQNSQCK